MRSQRALFFLLAICTGCAGQHAAQSLPAVPTTRAAIGISPDPKSNLTLEQIQPAPISPATQPTTKPAQAPIDALALYARARDALASGHRFTAISSLEKAITLDPSSPELYRELSRAYLTSGNQEKAIAALSRACELDPNNARSQMSLGRLYLLHNDSAAALPVLRLAMQCHDYQTDDSTAALTDYFLARALQQLGYDRAALDRYEALLDKLQRPNLELRSDRELAEWLGRPEIIFADVAHLYEKRGQYEPALQVWQTILHNNPDDYDARSRAIDMMLALGQKDAALKDAADTVARSGGSPQSLALLRDVAHRVGRDDAVVESLRRVLRDRPNDRVVLFAMSDQLVSAGRAEDAEKLLADAARKKWDLEIIGKLLAVYADEQKSVESARLLIEACAARPENSPQLLSMFDDLVDSGRRDFLRASDVEKISVPGRLEASKQLFLSCAAKTGRRFTLMREAIDRATTVKPAFAPAWRVAMVQIFSRTDVDPPKRKALVDALIARAQATGDVALTNEMRTLATLLTGKPADAITMFIDRWSHVDSSSFVANVLDAGDSPKYEQVLWKMISDLPEYDEPYRRLIEFELANLARDQAARGAGLAMNVLQRWLTANPSSARARTVEVQLLVETGAVQDALHSAGDLVRNFPNDRLALIAAAQTYTAAGAQSQLISILESVRARARKNVNVVDWLSQLHHESHRDDDALRAIDALQKTTPVDARLMYQIAQIYSHIDQHDRATAAFESALRLDPNDPGVNNDLGYNYADQNENLERAEKMIRRALDLEPDNSAFLDSMGWVLYKRAKFAEARHYLEQATRSGALPDPTMLDHLGDTLYRLHDETAARNFWQQALVAPTADVSEAALLRQAIEQKLSVQTNGEPVEVAPIGEKTAGEKSAGENKISNRAAAEK